MTLRLKLAHKKNEIQVAIPPQEAAKETFGDLKQLAAQQVGIDAQYLRLLFRGREKRDEENVLLSGVKNGHIINVVETADYMRQRAAAAAMPSRPAVEPVHIINLNTSQQSGPQSSQASVTSPTPAENGSTLGPQPGPQAAAQQSPAAGQGQGHQPPQEASSPQPQPHPQPEPQDEGAAMLGRIAAVHADVDSLAARAGALMAEVDWEARKKQKAMLTELLTRHLLTLDSIQAVGGETPPEVRAARKAEIVRINQLMDNLDSVS